MLNHMHASKITEVFKRNILETTAPKMLTTGWDGEKGSLLPIPHFL